MVGTASGANVALALTRPSRPVIETAFKTQGFAPAFRSMRANKRVGDGLGKGAEMGFELGVGLEA
jgi:hypothetical protein